MGMMDKFGRGSNIAQQGYYNSRLQSEEKEKERVLKGYCYFKNDLSGIEYHLYNYLSTMMHPQSLKQMKLITVNYVPKIVKRLCLAYKVPPVIKMASET